MRRQRPPYVTGFIKTRLRGLFPTVPQPLQTHLLEQPNGIFGDAFVIQVCRPLALPLLYSTYSVDPRDDNSAYSSPSTLAERLCGGEHQIQPNLS